MTKNFDGCSENLDLQRFYRDLLKNNELRAGLMDCKTRNDFADAIMKLAKAQGYAFSRAELDETFSPFPGTCTVDMGNDRIQKIMEMGWAPLDYSR